MSREPLDDAELILLLKQDDANAFKQLYERYWFRMYSLAMNKLRRKEVAEELAQQLFATLWQKRHALDILNVKAYLTQSLKNLIVDYIRRNIQEEHYLEHLRFYFPSGSLSTTMAVQYDELFVALEDALLHLPEKTRLVFIKSRFEQLTIPEIAEEMQLSDKAIEYHLSRALAFLRKNLRNFSSVWLLVLLQ
ncbi:RNA polymerase sigma factor [Dyadobacter sp.]|uniref:RNA polymerase sigma factor n=1 Tax=Dyadobacter sp. TaxID=1914288 RepID=UPI003F721A59